MPRETVEAKARRYLAEGRLTVHHVGEDGIDADCRGSGAVYEVGFREGDWYCDCPARVQCAHLTALQLVTAPPAGTRPELRLVGVPLPG